MDLISKNEQVFIDTIEVAEAIVITLSEKDVS